jgi:hypothetical protein
MKMGRGSTALTFLTSILDGQLRAPVALPREAVPGIHFTGGWVGPKASMDNIGKRKISYLCRESNSESSVVQPMAWSPYRLDYEVSVFNIGKDEKKNAVPKSGPHLILIRGG